MAVSERALLGSCFGYAIRSQLPFNFLRTGNGDPLEISVHSEDEPSPQGRLVRSWTQDGNERFLGRLFDDGSGRYRLSVEGEGTFTIDTSAPRISVPVDGNRVKREERLWGIPALLCFLARGDLPLHAAAIEIEGEAILLAAPGTFGRRRLQQGARVWDIGCSPRI